MEHHPDRNQHDPQERGAVQGGQRGLRRPEGRAEEGGLRPLRPCRLRERQRRPGRRPGSAGGSPTSPRPSRTCSTTCSATSWAAARGRPRPARGARLGPALQPRLTLEEAYRGKQATITVPSSAACEVCHGTGAEGGVRALDLPDLLGPGQGAGAAGLLHRRADLPDLRRARPDHQEPLQGLRRRRPGAQGPHAQRQHPGRASRPAPGSGWPARARPGCAAGRRAISTSSSRSRRTRSSSATTRTSTAASRSR